MRWYECAARSTPGGPSQIRTTGKRSADDGGEQGLAGERPTNKDAHAASLRASARQAQPGPDPEVGRRPSLKCLERRTPSELVAGPLGDPRRGGVLGVDPELDAARGRDRRSPSPSGARLPGRRSPRPRAAGRDEVADLALRAPGSSRPDDRGEADDLAVCVEDREAGARSPRPSPARSGRSSGDEVPVGPGRDAREADDVGFVHELLDGRDRRAGPAARARIVSSASGGSGGSSATLRRRGTSCTSCPSRTSRDRYGRCSRARS